MTEAKSEVHVLNITYIYQFYTPPPQRNVTLRETECRFKTYISLYSTQTREGSL